MDVPNATVMVIEQADLFGLAQLHQLRGRVGRGAHESYCVLLADPATDEARARLDAMARISDGFELADVDLELRGEGALLGLRQSGVPDLRHARLARQRRLAAAGAHRRAGGARRRSRHDRPGRRDRRRGHPARVRRRRGLAGAAVDCGSDADRGGRAQGHAAGGASAAGAPGRPSDRVRESLFAILGDVTEARACWTRSPAPARSDSRRSPGAPRPSRSATLDGAALAAVRENARRLRYADRCTIRRQDGRRRLAADRAAGVTYDLVLLDPPYTMLSDLTDHLEATCRRCLRPAGGPCSSGRPATTRPSPALDVLAERAYGGTAVTVWRRG